MTTKGNLNQLPSTPAGDALGTTAAQITRLIDQARTQGPLPSYVAVEGPIGVGKTTLANLLSNAFGYPKLLENPEENPFLARFYEQGNEYALPTQLFFLLDRARQLGDLSKDDLLGNQLIADFILEKDELFASLTLDEEEMTLYQQISNSLNLQPPKPDLVIYLQASVDVLLERIHKRGITQEMAIDAEYLEALNEKYTEFFHYYNDCPLLIVNANELDLTGPQEHFRLLLEQILQMSGTRQFFNPNPTLL